MDPYDEGYQVGLNDEEPECPYIPVTDEGEDWWQGYEDGQIALMEQQE